MKYKLVLATSGSEAEQDFLDLPKKLYSKKELTQDKDAERALISGKHTLSKYFKFYPFVVCSDHKVVGRYAMTQYPDGALYIGFFECIDNSDVAKYIFNEAQRFAKKLGAKKIVGSVDASFWIKYRLKVGLFDDRPYMSEPYNKKYYEKFFAENGFRVTDRYSSFVYKKKFLPKKTKSEFTSRYSTFKKRSYNMVGVNSKNFDSEIRHVYNTIMALYSDFPVFSPISFKDFYKLFSPIKYISTPSFTKVAYYDSKPAGFIISFPNYHNTLCGNLSLVKKLGIMLKHLRSSQYVMLYIGVLPEHHGLAKALIKTSITALYLRLAQPIGALIHEGKPNAGYAKDAIEKEYEYVLMEKKI
jgi:hypothetical protein